MRTVSEGLLAGQRGASQKPAVGLVVRDKLPRFTYIGAQSYAAAQSAACVVGSVVVVAALDVGGYVRVRRVTDPSILDPTADPGSGWGWYSLDYQQVASGALAWPLGDVCLSLNGSTLRLFYVKGNGTEVLVKESADAGQTWSASATVCTIWGGGAGYRVRLASAGNNDIWYTIGREGYRYIHMGIKSGGAWGGFKHVQYLMETGGEYGSCYGLAALYDASSGKYQVVASLDRANNGDGRIVSAWWDYGPGVITGYQGVVPPGIPVPGYVPWSPGLFKTSDGLGPLYILTYWDTFASGSSSWSTPMAMFSRDFDHWSYRVPLGFYRTTARKRINAVELGGAVYLHNTNEAYRLDLWSAGSESMELTVGHEEVLRYRIMEYAERGVLHMELDNRTGKYDACGVAGGGAEALRPLSSLYVKQGLNLGGSASQVECRPFYLWHASHVRESGTNLCRLYGVDGWQLLRMWRPDCVIQWENRSLGWCLAELASRVGFWKVVTDGSAEWDQTLAYLTVAASYNDWFDRWYARAYGRTIAIDDPTVMFSPGVSGLVILRHLLNLVGGAARFGKGDDRDVLYCWIPAKQGASPVAAHTYQDSELISLQHVDGFGWPTRVVVIGNGVTYVGEDVASGLAAGMDFLQMVYTSHWTTVDQLRDIADGALDDSAARAWSGWMVTGPNVGLELGDVIAFSDAKCGAGLGTVKRRVNRIVTEYEPKPMVWRQTVYFEGV